MEYYLRCYYRTAMDLYDDPVVLQGTYIGHQRGGLVTGWDRTTLLEAFQTLVDLW